MAKADEEQPARWYAVRTVPGAQKPQREYAVETTNSHKGYRIVPSLDHNRSAVEKALDDAGFVHYMPAEKRLVRDRRHTDLWKGRRFALLVGYVFVRGPCHWRALEEVPGILGIVHNRGKPMEIDLLDILALRTMEAMSEDQFDKRSAAARKNILRKSRNNPNPILRKLAAKLAQADTMTIAFGEARNAA